MDRQRRHREDEASEDRQSRAPRPTEADGSDAAILDLQATAGNRAVTELLAAPGTDATTTTAQRDTPNGAPTAEPADSGAPTGGSTMSIPVLDLSVPLMSIQQGKAPSPGGTGGAGTAKPESSTAGEATVTFKADDLDPRLWTAAADGRTFETVTITFASMTLTLHGVVLSSVQTARDVVSITLNFSSRDVKPSAGGG